MARTKTDYVERYSRSRNTTPSEQNPAIFFQIGSLGNNEILSMRLDSVSNSLPVPFDFIKEFWS